VLEPVVKKPASSKKSAARVETPKAAPVEESEVSETEAPAEEATEVETPAEEAAAEETTEAAPAEESEEK
jgi:large subunit ribosomal protein L17